ncbi:MAG: SRPBCC domain-containing protein [Actinomycetota bacterium]
MSEEIATHSLLIDAPIDVVFALLTTGEGLCAWMAVDATVDATPDGAISWTHENGATVRGRFTSIIAPRRVAFTYGWVGNTEIPPESTVVEIDLESTNDGATQLQLRHRLLPPEERVEHEHGWQYFTGRLAAVAPGWS